MSRRLIAPSLLAIICLVFVNLCTAACSNCTFTVASEQHLGNITSTNAFVVRDLGYHGTIGSWEINTYGDTFHCQYQDAVTSQDCSPVCVNSASTDTDDPRRVTDINPNNGVPRQFVPFDDTEQPGYDWGMGLTNVVATSDSAGVVYFARNHRPGGNGVITGAGVAVVDCSGTFPVAHRTATQWWDANTEPVWGDHGAVDGHDGYIYVLGAFGSLNLYIARVMKSQATNLDSYQYWDGNDFTSNRLHNPTDDQAIFPSNAGTPFWSDYYNCWAYIGRAWWDQKGITLRTATKLTGPWTDEGILFEAPVIEGTAYSPTVHQHYDTSGKTLTVTYTAEPNQQMAHKVTLS